MNFVRKTGRKTLAIFVTPYRFHENTAWDFEGGFHFLIVRAVIETYRKYLHIDKLFENDEH
jgi:hypothetical protein